MLPRIVVLLLVDEKKNTGAFPKSGVVMLLRLKRRLQSLQRHQRSRRLLLQTSSVRHLCDVALRMVAVLKVQLAIVRVRHTVRAADRSVVFEAWRVVAETTRVTRSEHELPFGRCKCRRDGHSYERERGKNLHGVSVTGWWWVSLQLENEPPNTFTIFSNHKSWVFLMHELIVGNAIVLTVRFVVDHIYYYVS